MTARDNYRFLCICQSVKRTATLLSVSGVDDIDDTRNAATSTEISNGDDASVLVTLAWWRIENYSKHLFIMQFRNIDTVVTKNIDNI
jgi:hypothetical protein